MSGLALMEVQRALYTKLQGDGVLMAMVTGVYDAVPQKTPTPYIVIGDGDCEDIAAEALNLSELRLRLDVWTDAFGRKTALAIMNRIYSILHLGTLTLSGYQLVTLRCEQADTQLSEQATHIQGSLVARATIVEA
jgi:hypothetical protein